MSRLHAVGVGRQQGQESMAAINQISLEHFTAAAFINLNVQMTRALLYVESEPGSQATLEEFTGKAQMH